MSTVTFEPSGKTVVVENGTDVLAAARAAGLEFDSPCGGKGTCGNCGVRVVAGDVVDESRGVLTHAAVAHGYVLACRARVTDTPVTIYLPETFELEGARILADDETYLVRPELLLKDWQYDPIVVKWLVHVAPAETLDGFSDLDRLIRAMRREWGNQEIVCSFGVVRELPETLRAEEGVVTVTVVRDGERFSVIRCEPGNQTTRLYAIAVDVGTTTVAVQLINLATRKILATRSAYNDQIKCGLDVISRINYAGRPGGLKELRNRVRETINRLVAEACRSNDIAPREVSSAVVSGNTTMNHLLLGITPEYLRLAPYTPAALEIPSLTAREVGIEINRDARVYFSPNSGSYVGGDITAGLLCTELSANTDDIQLFMDIGTNAEVVVGNRDFLMSCACSAGPAFEGGGIHCGMRAALGAIEKVDVDPATGRAAYSTIGGVPPRGICGTGVIECLANLLMTGWIDPAGKLDRSGRSPAIEYEGRRARYVIATAEESATGEAIFVSELDFENVIRAKAAIYSACALLLQQIGIGFEDLTRIYIAGGFGRFLDLEKAMTIGLVPDFPRDRFHFIGNASLMGSYQVVISQDYRQDQMKLARRMTYIDLSVMPGYMDEYTAALFLPHTNQDRFPTIKERIMASNKDDGWRPQTRFEGVQTRS
ncbi:MAG: DUF4445 domain-containing protein [Candidatus Hydrogenedentes bacterium]|nr:DUF4445 domain-containing protein [Candidatus Hydrogenedentota bacterium]